MKISFDENKLTLNLSKTTFIILGFFPTESNLPVYVVLYCTMWRYGGKHTKQIHIQSPYFKKKLYELYIKPLTESRGAPGQMSKKTEKKTLSYNLN